MFPPLSSRLSAGCRFGGLTASGSLLAAFLPSLDFAAFQSIIAFNQFLFERFITSSIL